MRVFTTIIISLFFVFNSFAQYDHHIGGEILEKFIKLSFEDAGEINEVLVDLEKVEGTPFLDKNFVIGTLSDKLTDTNYSVYARYNIYNDQVEILKDESIYSILKSKNYSSKIGNDNFIFVKDTEHFTAGTYLKELTTGDKSSLYAHYKCTYQPPKKNDNPLKQDIKARFSNFTDYFVKINHIFYKIPKSKSEFLDLFGEQSDKIKNYMKKEGLSHKKERDLVRIVTFYNNL